jgi:hypothetical protein
VELGASQGMQAEHYLVLYSPWELRDGLGDVVAQSGVLDFGADQENHDQGSSPIKDIKQNESIF